MTPVLYDDQDWDPRVHQGGDDFGYTGWQFTTCGLRYRLNREYRGHPVMDAHVVEWPLTCVFCIHRIYAWGL